MPYYIAFDLSHKPRGKIDENYTELRDHLNANGFICYNFLETPITQETLKIYDILTFVCPDFSKISHQEIMEIVNWVKEDGGSLLLLNHAGGDKGRNSNLDELGENFGITFESDQVLDETNNLGMENLPIITAANFIPPHPVTKGINEICYRAGCSLTILGGAISIVSSNETSEPFSSPLICASEPGNGRVVAIGSYEMFRDKTGGGFQHDEHGDLVLNIFNWLISEYRMELTQHGTNHDIPVPSVQTSNQLTEQYLSPISSSLQEQDFKSIKSIKQFSSRQELVNLLNSYLDQINTIKNSIEHIIKVVSTQDSNILWQAPENVQNYQQSHQRTIKARDESYLSELPPKPRKLVKEQTNGQVSEKGTIIGVDPVKSIERNTIEKSFLSDSNKGQFPKRLSESKKETKAITKEKYINKNKEEVQAELEGLESKLNSIFNLINFIEKKHDSGKLDDKSYNKQIKKLQKDMEQTKARIEEIKTILE
ncbi:MAG: hypothetical protein ACFFAN_04405 [Promethearchaeota archaeon]